MEKKLINDMRRQLQNLYRMKDVQSSKLDIIGTEADAVLKRRKSETQRAYYYARNRDGGGFVYLGDEESDKLNAVRSYKFYKNSLTRIEANIAALESALERIRPTGYVAINESLPLLYKNPKLSDFYTSNNSAAWKEKAEALKSRYDIYRPEELVIKTDDGNRVRSKSEAMIYNYLLSMGVSFVYELPLKLGHNTVFPDFTLLSEIDADTEVIIEHQGMMGNDYYRSRFNDKLYKYLKEGYIPGLNILFTFDGLDGSFDKTPVENLVATHIRL